MKAREFGVCAKGGCFLLSFSPAERKNMGEPNNALKAYVNRPDRIRDLLEYYLGEKLPEDWQRQEISGFVTVRNSKGKLTFRERDFLGKACAWGFHFQLGLENQDSVNLIYPWRLMEWDCLAYGKEIEEIKEKNSAGEEKYGTEDDFKYHYKKEDRLEPILNLMLYWGRKAWDRPKTLRDMMTDTRQLPGKLGRLTGNYNVHIISMRFIPEDSLQKMDSDLKYVLGIMKCTASRKRYEKFILENRDYFSRIPRSAVDVIDTCTNIKDFIASLQYVFNQETGEEETDLCKALKDIKKHEKKKGFKQGVKQGVTQGEYLGTVKTLCSLVNDGMLKLEEGARRANLSAEAFGAEMKKAGYH